MGLDPNLDHLPDFVKDLSVEDKIFSYNKAIIDATHDLVAVYKPQAAYYEGAGLEGLTAYKLSLIHI